jgi:hypothetical protein
VAPWLIRNSLNVPADSPSLALSAMLEGSYRGYIFAENPATFPYGGVYDPSFESMRRSLFPTLEAIATKISSDPLGMMKWYFIEKPVYLFQWSNIDGVGDIYVYPVLTTPFNEDISFKIIYLIFKWLHPVLLSLAFLNCIMPWMATMSNLVPSHNQTTPKMARLMLIFLYLVHLPFVAPGRYAVPLYPMMYLLAVSTIVMAWQIGRNVWPSRV